MTVKQLMRFGVEWFYGKGSQNVSLSRSPPNHDFCVACESVQGTMYASFASADEIYKIYRDITEFSHLDQINRSVKTEQSSKFYLDVEWNSSEPDLTSNDRLSTLVDVIKAEL